MLERNVVIQFPCCHCQHDVSATLRCSGTGIKEGPHVAAAVHLPCPTCDQMNQVYFELTGMVLAVQPEEKKSLLEPSLN